MKRVEIYTVPGCNPCKLAVGLAEELCYYVSVLHARDLQQEDWIDMIGFVPRTAPQIFVDGAYIGGYVEFKAYIARNTQES